MPADPELAQRVRDALFPHGSDLAEIRMFGGLCFTLRGHMVAGVEGDRLMVRFPKEDEDAVLGRPHVAPMDFTGRPMRGLAFVAAESLRTERQLREWLDLSVETVQALPPKKPRKRKPPLRKTSAKA